MRRQLLTIGVFFLLGTATVQSQTIDSLLLQYLQDSFTVSGDCVKFQSHWEFRPWTSKETKEDVFCNTLLTFLQSSDSLFIELNIHSDCRGHQSYNQDLTQRTAEETAYWFFRKGIAKHRIIPKGYGESRPLIDCSDCNSCSEEEHDQNQRLEIILR